MQNRLLWGQLNKAETDSPDSPDRILPTFLVNLSQNIQRFSNPPYQILLRLNPMVAIRLLLSYRLSYGYLVNLIPVELKPGCAELYSMSWS